MSRRGWASLAFIAATAALVWTAAPELPAPARVWTTVLVAALPVLTIRQAGVTEQLLSLPRSAIYLQTGVFLWILAGVTLLVAAESGIEAARFGLRGAGAATIAIAATATTAAGIAIVVAAERLGLHEPPVVRHLLPVSGSDKLAFAALSLTAGFCEELVFRGFLIEAIVRASGMLWLALLVSSALFGVLHAYQQPAGAARSAALGLLLAAPLIATGSLWPSIIAHAVLDLAAGFWLRDRLLR